ncbi:phosphatase PAP2 family protein [Actinomadura sp. HBU206391]|uniref:phosphatase PAP2 family protein n=1 Tax=Actinomadura sp. HBU206391 TaxID=2731692 RepID=UPI0016506AE9|nr:phosphatase PAP2 family protein [Actinomadura sp. HBU206391]MBC6461445.1 phosphatase PAP2 family protein [Actinomadura sp. HBU206391]
MLTEFMRFISFIGSAGFYLPILVLVFWCVSPRVGARAAVVLAFSAAINTLLKLLWHAPRPYWTDQSVKAHQSLSSFGMPSGHAQGSAVAWGLAGVQARRRAVWVLVVAVVFLVGVSRVYLGMHSIQQVLAGWGIGVALLVLALALEPIVVPWWTRRALAVQLLLSVVVAAAVLAATALAVEALSGRPLPEAWARAIELAGGRVRPVSLAQGGAATGTLLGVLTGLSWLAHSGWLDAGGSPLRRLARVPLGFAGAAAIWVVGLFAGTQVIVVFVVHTLLSLWITAGAPAAFVRLGLARREVSAVRAESLAQGDTRSVT